MGVLAVLRMCVRVPIDYVVDNHLKIQFCKDYVSVLPNERRYEEFPRAGGFAKMNIEYPTL